MRIETMADRVRGVIVNARGLELENPAALIYAPSSCGGEPAGDRAELARALRDDRADAGIDRRERAIVARDHFTIGRSRPAFPWGPFGPGKLIV